MHKINNYYIIQIIHACMYRHLMGIDSETLTNVPAPCFADHFVFLNDKHRDLTGSPISVVAIYVQCNIFMRLLSKLHSFIMQY